MTLFCNFRVLDSAGEDCYEVIVGEEYTILTCLCEECRHGFNECATDKGIRGEILILEWEGNPVKMFPKTEYDGETQTSWICPTVVEEGYYTLTVVLEHGVYSEIGRDLIVHYACKEGETECRDYDLYKCIGGEWKLMEHDSIECGYIPEPPTPCPIACICYGTDLIDALGPIREFRDTCLKKHKLGKIFVNEYYNHLSPRLSPLLQKSVKLRVMGRAGVRVLLKMLK